MTTWRWIAKSVKWLVIVLLAFVAFVVAINAFDESPQPIPPEITAGLLKPVEPANNGYFVVLALRSGTDKNANAEGQQAWQKWLDAAKRSNPWESLDANLLTDIQQLPEPPISLDCPREGNCLSALLTQTTALSAALLDHAVTRQRCAQAAGSTSYAEPPPAPTISTLPLAHFTWCGRVSRASAVEHLHKKDVSAALQAIQADMELSRKQLAGSQSLIHKMIAVANARNAIRFAGEVAIAQPELRQPIKTVLKPFADDAMDLRPMWAGEALYQDALNRTIDPAKPPQPFFTADPRQTQSSPEDLADRLWRPIWGHFYKREATRNAMLQIWRQSIISSAGSPTQISEHFESRASGANGWLHPGRLYNPVGRILHEIAVPEYGVFPLRVYDTEAHRQLVLASIDLLDANLPISERANFIAQWPANDYAKGRLQYDAQRNAVVLSAWAPRSDRPAWQRVSLNPAQ